MKKIVFLLFWLNLLVKAEDVEIKLTEVTDSLDQPWSLTFIEKNKVLITEKHGRIIQINLSTKKRKKIEHNLKIHAYNQGGLLDILYHKDTVYISYSEQRDDVKNQDRVRLSSTSIAKAAFNSDYLLFSNIFRAEPPIESGYHFGSRLVIKDSYLYATIGERGLGMIAQDGKSHPGSVIRTFLDGTVPQNNPKFLDLEKKDWLPEIYMIGVRNPQGLTLSSFDNKVYMSNHGAKGGDWFGSADEPGGNYGWKILGWGGTNYDSTSIGPKWLPGFVKPLIYWVPSIAVSAIIIYEGNEFSDWNGSALITSLKDQSLRKLSFSNSEVLNEKLIFKGKIGRIRDIKIQNDTGKIYLLSDHGSLWLLENKSIRIKGDVNGDQVIDIFDLVMVADQFGQKGYDLIGDINSDGSVNIFDLVLVANYFGRNTTNAAPAVNPDVVLSNEQKKHITTGISYLEDKLHRSDEEEFALGLLKSILPKRFTSQTQLLANYPNPFNPETWIPFRLAQSSTVTARIYDSLGNQIRVIELGYLRAGNYTESNKSIYWDGKNKNGEQVSSGIYFYEISAGNYTEVRKMVVLQ